MEKSWLYIESFVFIFTKYNKGIVYNTINYKSFEFDNTGLLKEKVQIILNPNSLYTVELHSNDLKDKQIKRFVKCLKDSFSGNIFITSNIEDRPLILPPVLKLDILKKNLIDGKVYDKDILNNLKNIILYINGNCNLNCINCNVQYLQFKSCKKSQGSLSLNDIKGILSYFKGNSQIIFDIVGGDICLHKNWNELVDYFSTINLRLRLNFHFENIIPYLENFNYKIVRSNIYFNIIINYYNNSSVLRKIIEKIQSNLHQVEWLFVTENSVELNKALNIIHELKLVNYLIKPVYNRKNIHFFKEHVFLEKSDIVANKLSKRLIFQNTILNSYNFGKFFYDTDGKVYANFNYNSIGEIVNPVKDLIYKEISFGKSWLLTRGKVDPCKKCLYKELCPSISSYELFFGKFNFCNINFKSLSNEKEIKLN